MYLLAPSILQNVYKKLLELIQSYEDVRHFWDQNSPFALSKIFWYKPLLLLSSTYWPFSLRKILKNSYNGSRIMTMHHFWAQSGPFAPQIFFFRKWYYYHSHLPISSFHCAKFKKNYLLDPELCGCAIYGPKMVHFLK